uniref:Uncharacterized protein n=1 Tax=Otus sunia TaxID=257818 RepID=A0A8C8E736_9STRI
RRAEQHHVTLGAGKAIAVLTSGGDAQGKGHPGDPKTCGWGRRGVEL